MDRHNGRRSMMLSPTLAGEINRARVLKTLYARGALSRPDLARFTGSTRATIGQIVQPLIDEGLLAEQEKLASGAQGGKPARPVWFSDDGWPVGAVLLLPDGAQAALVSAGGTIVATRELRFRPRQRDHAGIVADLAGALREVSAPAAGPLRGVGVAVGGMVDTVTGSVVRVDLAPGFNHLPVGPMIEKELGVPVFVDNHSRAQALGDLLFGAGRGRETFCSVYIGKGIGAGFILDGALHQGARGSGGEVGHAVVDRGGPECGCGLTGCWEALAATRWLRAAARDAGLPAAARMDAGRLVRLAGTSAPAAGVLTAYAENIALGLANLQQTLGLGLFIVHGDPVAGGEQLRHQVERELRTIAFAHPGGDPEVVFADSDDYATLRGVAGIVLSRSLHVAF